MTGLMQPKEEKPVDYEATVKEALTNYLKFGPDPQGDADPKWESLYVATAQAAIAIGENDIFRAAFWMAALGHVEAELELAPSIKKARKHQKPITDKNKKFAYLESKVVLGAVLRWQNDTEQVYKMKQMTDSIMSTLPKYLRKKDDPLPKASTIRGWIKPYAPPYASDPGRTSQKKSKSTKNG
ncbi:MAG: hypothetical protein IID60_07290 [Proteobacteria bacterium]|nr:hypothetical protein [Pseudomonadota bacterium]